MAVIKEFPGLVAAIRVDGQDLQEYDDPYIEDDDEPQVLATATKSTEAATLTLKTTPIVIKYIEAIPGKEFECHFNKAKEFKGDCHHLAIRFVHDGHELGLHHDSDDNFKKSWTVTAGCEYYDVPGKGRYRRNRQFAPLETVETNEFNKENITKDLARGKPLGTIRCLVYKMNETARTPDYVWLGNKESWGKPYELPETTILKKAVKGRALYTQASFGFQDPQGKPFAVFEFRYRTKKGLIEECILPRPNPLDSMDGEEIRVYAQKLQEERDQLLRRLPELNQEQIGEEKAVSNTVRSGKRSRSSNILPPASKRRKETVNRDGHVEIDLSD
ncbi:hypothetical protein F5Y16DRAFT_405981 [Xylariaceae sp. FL0255]|nr:hypothetical protein F5Y16DRAFT_405981 [Xylariaceae sp. FL0255]